jgi:hypothetical protein
MSTVQFSTLYREFLFRMMDRDLLAVHAQGDANKLLGRFAAILICVSIGFAGMAFGIHNNGPRDLILMSALAPEHAIIATTMLIVGLFAVLSWDSMFPDRRDVLILMPLPLSAVTIVLAKAAALAAALGIAVAVFNGIPGVLFPFALTPAGSGLLDMLFSIQFYRAVAAYWLTVLLSGAFILCSVICLQAITAQLPRRLFLRVSSILQIATFCICVTSYFLQPSLTSVEQLTAQANRQLLACLPSYWFLGMFQQLNGFPAGLSQAILADLAGRAWAGLAVTGIGAAAAILLSCLRTLRTIAEAPDIVPTRSQRRSGGMRFGSPLDTAIVQFSLRTLVRSRHHRVLMAFYAGVGFAIVILFLNTPFAQKLSATSVRDPWHFVSLPLLGSSFVMMCCWIFGIHGAFAIPMELRANWAFRLAIGGEAKNSFRASRRALYVIGLLPCWLVAAAVFLYLWPFHQAAQHLLVLGVLGLTLSMLCLSGFHKIPFTCSFLPGKSNLHITVVLCLMLGLNFTFWAANYERRALFDPSRYLLLLAVLVVAAAVAWWRMDREVEAELNGLQFEEEMQPAIISLGLHCDEVSPS